MHVPNTTSGQHYLGVSTTVGQQHYLAQDGREDEVRRSEARMVTTDRKVRVELVESDIKCNLHVRVLAKVGSVELVKPERERMLGRERAAKRACTRACVRVHTHAHSFS